MDPEEYADLVLACADSVPPARVTTYGAIAEVVGGALGGGGPRQVAAVLALRGGEVPWWRVVRADGSLPSSHQAQARLAYRAEGTPLRESGRVDLPHAFFAPVLPLGEVPTPTSHRASGPSPRPAGWGRIAP